MKGQQALAGVHGLVAVWARHETGDLWQAARVKDALLLFQSNDQGRDFVVGDIHGYFQTLERLLEVIGFDTSVDRLFSIGDLIDRGPESHRAGEFIAKPWFHAIRGNHEQMLCDAVTPGLSQPAALDLWQANGGDWFDSVADAERIALFQAIRELPLAMEIPLAGGGVAVLAHADLSSADWPRQRAQLADAARQTSLAETLLWSRRRARSVFERLQGAGSTERIAVDGASVVFFGHTPMPAPVACDNTRWIDTGVFMSDGRLTIAELAVDGAVWSLADADERPQNEWQHCVSAPAGPPPAPPKAGRRNRWLPWRR